MKPSVLNRKIHYWARFTVAVPMLVMIGSGLFLQMKKHWGWIQAPEQRGTGSAPVLDLEGILARVKSVPRWGLELGDVNRLDAREFGSSFATSSSCRGMAKRT